jgi:hypothetical protein
MFIDMELIRSKFYRQVSREIGEYLLDMKMLLRQFVFLYKYIFIVEFYIWRVFPVLIGWIGNAKLATYFTPKPKGVKSIG